MFLIIDVIISTSAVEKCVYVCCVVSRWLTQLPALNKARECGVDQKSASFSVFVFAIVVVFGLCVVALCECGVSVVWYGVVWCVSMLFTVLSCLLFSSFPLAS